jgi:hypothetical protein
VSTAREAVVAVLEEADAPLHWTVVLDRALRGGHLDPFTTPDVRGEVQRALHALVAEGVITKAGKGVYVAAGPGQGR